MIQITCKGNSASCTRTERLTSGMVGLQCEFIFDEAWDGLAKTAVFQAGSEKRRVLLTGAICKVPPEVMRKPGYQLVIGVFGTNADGALVIPTCYAMCGGIGPGADPSGDESTDPTLPVWGQLQGMIGNLNDLQTTSKDNLVAAINEAAQSGGGGGSAVALDTTLSEAGKAADAKAVGDALNGKQPKGDYLTQNELPDMTAYRTAEAQDVIDAGKQDTLIQSGASVGQIAKITAVDDTGKPTAWEAVDMPDKLPNPNALTFTGAVESSYDGSAPLEVAIPSGGGEKPWRYDKLIEFSEDTAGFTLDTFDDGSPFDFTEIEVRAALKNASENSVWGDVQVHLDGTDGNNKSHIIGGSDSSVSSNVASGKYYMCVMQGHIDLSAKTVLGIIVSKSATTYVNSAFIFADTARYQYVNYSYCTQGKLNVWKVAPTKFTSVTSLMTIGAGSSVWIRGR